ncbi:hypothetical protein QE410_001586 [Microbacterium sp. SORGH_AS 1204]|nr:hypothetical protein [Microbacterium sp. SORGH_AS_1204]
MRRAGRARSRQTLRRSRRLREKRLVVEETARRGVSLGRSRFSASRSPSRRRRLRARSRRLGDAARRARAVATNAPSGARGHEKRFDGRGASATNASPWRKRRDAAFLPGDRVSRHRSARPAAGRSSNGRSGLGMLRDGRATSRETLRRARARVRRPEGEGFVRNAPPPRKRRDTAFRPRDAVSRRSAGDRGPDAIAPGDCDADATAPGDRPTLSAPAPRHPPRGVLGA